MSSEIHVAFHVARKGMSSMGVSSSSECMRVRCSGLKPLSMCWQSCFVVRWSVLSWLAWYIVLCRSVLRSVISVMSSGAGLVVSGEGRVSGMLVVRRLLGLILMVEAVIRLA